MELYPGTSIPPEEKVNLKCKSKWNSVRKAYADFLGKPYIISPVYTSNKTLKNTIFYNSMFIVYTSVYEKNNFMISKTFKCVFYKKNTC